MATSIVQNIVKTQSTPLDRMPFGSPHPFPVEIWKYIFSLIEDPIQYSAYGHRTYQYFFSEEDESHLWDLDTLPDYSAFHTRHSIVLTCRSWYYIGITTLWSHILLKGTNLRIAAPKIHDALKRDATLGPGVRQLSIVHTFAYDLRSMADFIQEILSFIPNLEALYCPVQVLGTLPSSFRTNIVAVQGKFTLTVEQSLRSYDSFFNDVFWRHCRTLSLTSPLWHLDYATNETPITFPDLINLRINVIEPHILSWIVTAWHLPALKNFSMIFPKHPRDRRAIAGVTLAPLLRRLRLQLERIQVPVMFAFSTSIGNKVELPRLTDLHLLNLFEEKKSILEHGRCIITAPNLRLFTFYAYSDQPYEQDYCGRLNLTELKLRSVYPSIKKIDIIATRGEWVGPNFYKPKELVAKIEDIVDWMSSKEEVRIIVGTRGDVEIFTPTQPETYQGKRDSTARLIMRERR